MQVQNSPDRSDKPDRPMLTVRGGGKVMQDIVGASKSPRKDGNHQSNQSNQIIDNPIVVVHQSQDTNPGAPTMTTQTDNLLATLKKVTDSNTDTLEKIDKISKSKQPSWGNRLPIGIQWNDVSHRREPAVRRNTQEKTQDKERYPAIKWAGVGKSGPEIIPEERMKRINECRVTVKSLVI